ncbi:MAG: prephenate dehydrogenase [Lachnospiraceae bacterium]|nr:prephenate dehydrogenase [Lachnospiraceae bacterium]
MEWINDSNILIVGLGLMGGSYAKALKRMGYHVFAIDKNPESVEYALTNGIIDRGASEGGEELIKAADAIVVALYPSAVAGWISDNQKFFKPGLRITDVTGIKSAVVFDVLKILRKDVEFIAAHPMAGREVSGVKNSDDGMFKDANYIVVATPENTQDAIKWCKGLGRILGFKRICVLSPKEHDRVIAFVSQLTHCIAVSLMTCTDNEHLVDYTGDSFRDLTRIARINENMWTELFFMNKESLLREMNLFIDEFNSIRDLIEKEDAEGLKEKMRLSTKRRALFDKKQG